MEKTGAFRDTADENVNGTDDLQKSWQLLKMLNLELLYDPAIQSQGIYPGELKTGSRNTRYMNVHSSIILMSKRWR